MARAKKRAFNGLTGRLGDTVIYERNGKIVQRKIGIYTKPATTLQENQRTKMVIYNEFRAPVQELIKVGYASAAKALHKTTHDVFAAHILNDCITGAIPNLEIDYPSVLFSQGTMPATPDIKVVRTIEGLTFTWDTNLIAGKFRHDDQVMLLIYFPKPGTAEFDIYAAKREAGEVKINIHRRAKPTIIETYISFRSERSIANSTYTGRFTLPARKKRRSENAVIKSKKYNYGNL